MELCELSECCLAAWCEPDRVCRQQILERIWDEDRTYTDPTVHVAGRRGLIDHIGGFFEQFPGARIEPASEIDSHYRKIRFNWRMVLAVGKVFLEGFDFGGLITDGKLRQIVGFFGPLAAKP